VQLQAGSFHFVMAITLVGVLFSSANTKGQAAWKPRSNSKPFTHATPIAVCKAERLVISSWPLGRARRMVVSDQNPETTEADTPR